MAKIEQIAQHFIGAATANPKQKHEICRQAAYAFMDAAQNPKNVRAMKPLSEMGLAFARAATVDRPPVIEDFEDLLKETADAYEQAGPWGDDPMDLIARRREIHEDRTPRLPGQVYITPESFNVDVTLGRSQKIKWQPTDEDKLNQIQKSQTVAFWQGVKKEAQAMTVDVSLGFQPATVQQTDTPFDTIDNRAYAEVEFGSDGNRNKVVLDLARGQRLTVVGNYVSVIVGMDAPRTGFHSDVLEAGASIGAFAAPSHAPVIRTVYIDNLTDNHSSALIPIPLKAVVLLTPLFSGNLNLGTISLYFSDAGGNHLVEIPYTPPLTALSRQPIVIPGDAAFVSIDNFTGSTLQTRLPFELSL